MTIATGIIVMVALTVVGTISVAVVYAIIVGGRDWWRELLSARVLPFLFLGLAVGATTLGIGYTAKYSADVALHNAVKDIEADCDDQLSLLLHTDAVAFSDKMTSNAVPHSSMMAMAEYYVVDEYTVVGPDGRVLDTSAPGVKVGDSFFKDENQHGPYRELLNGERTSVRQRFCESAVCPGRFMKYFGLAIPHRGFIQVGYTWETFEREFPRFFLSIFEERVVGATGFCVVLNDQDIVEVHVPKHPEAMGMHALKVGLTKDNLSAPLGTIFRARIFGTLCRCMYYPDSIAGRRIIAAVPLSERQGPALVLAFGVSFVLLVAFLVFRLVLRSFRRAQAKIDALRALEEEHRAGDLALARSIQLAELRTDGTEGDGYRIASQMNAAREVGGDFYDYYELPDGRLVVTIADVSGKGVPAAFFMMKARVTLKSSVYSLPTLAEAVARANVRLAGKNPAEMFVTAWVGIYDRKTGILEFASAGHNPPLVKRKDGSVEWVNAPRTAALGVFESAKYRGARLNLASGDRLYLYTDGVNEAMNHDGELFGNERLEATLKDAGDSLVQSVQDAIETFVAGAEQSDDITMLELDIT